MKSVRHGLRSGIRLSRRSPGHVGLIVVILGLGIGATTAALSVASSVLFSPLPVADESRLVLITKTLSAGSTLMPFSYAEIAAWRDASRTLESVAGVQYDGAWPWPAQYRDRALTVTGATVTGDFFATLGAQPVFGRLLTAEDAKVGADDVAVLGYGLWRRQFGGDPTIVGQRHAPERTCGDDRRSRAERFRVPERSGSLAAAHRCAGRLARRMVHAARAA